MQDPSSNNGAAPCLPTCELLGEQRLRQLVSAVAQADWDLDGEGRFIGDSARWRALTGQ